MVARAQSTYLKLGTFSLSAVKFALHDHPHRVSNQLQLYNHSYIRKIRFEGEGALGGTEICLSPELNVLIGIRGSGKSSVLEAIRYALNISFGDKASDVEYKEGLVKNLLYSGGKITLDAVDRRVIPIKSAVFLARGQMFMLIINYNLMFPSGKLYCINQFILVKKIFLVLVLALKKI